jgi:hypothetical protein
MVKRGAHREADLKGIREQHAGERESDVDACAFDCEKDAGDASSMCRVERSKTIPSFFRNRVRVLWIG